MRETKIYVGLNDWVTRAQKFETEKYVSILKNVCYQYRLPFSFTMAEGGYFHEDGEYTQEKTLIITLLDAEAELAEEMARDLCVFFHQESVLVTSGEIDAHFVMERVEPPETGNKGEEQL